MGISVRHFVLLFVLMLLGVKTQAENLSGLVVRVADGDTVTVLVDKNEIKVRLAGIDAPEKKQPYGTASKKNLSELTYQKVVTLQCGKTDRYKRRVCTVLNGDQDVCLAQIQSGMAWWYRKYAREQTKEERASYAAAEEDARLAQRGLWSDNDPAPPWEWRHR